MEEKELDQKREKFVEDAKDYVKNIFSSEEETKDDLAEKREKFVTFINEKKSYLVYLALGIIIWLSSAIRIGNLRLLKDVTTGEYIPMALDPHLFTKYARYIIEHGNLLAHDPTRFVPLGTGTIKNAFTSYVIAYLYKILHFFDPVTTVEYASIIYPVYAFALAMFFFFLLVRRLFDWKVSLLATLFLALVPAFLHRTMAGFADHEALGIMLMFMALYFYVIGWQDKRKSRRVGWGLAAGIFTGLMGLSWGGWKFLILIISLYSLVEFFFNRSNELDLYQYAFWVIGFVLGTTTFIPAFSLKDFLGSFTTGVAFLVLFILLVDLILFKYNLFKIKEKIQGKVPDGIVSIVISLIVGVIALSVVFGPVVILGQFEEISDSLLHPLGNDRWELTVAEQHQPFFTSWIGQFGPNILNIPAYLTLFMVGSIILFYFLVQRHKEKLWMTLIYTGFLLAFTMSRYSSGSQHFNGTSFIAKLFYLGSLVIFVGLGVYFYLRAFYKDKETYQKILTWNKTYILVLIWFLILVVAARGAVRLFFIFVPITAIVAAYGWVQLINSGLEIKNKSYRYLALFFLIFILLSPLGSPSKGIIPSFYESSLQQGMYAGPGYNQQWQHTGQWVRENLPEDAVFGHWWDYGYWVQNGFRRAAMLDGQNAIKYWNYLMGRHVLTAQSQEEALEFLNVHEVTHYLIVADEIGKYTAYSSIGSDADNDRYSWITTFSLDETATQETRNNTVLFYRGGYMLDDDFVWEGKVYPGRQAGIGAVFLPVQEEVSEDNETMGIMFEQPSIALMYQGQRTDVPLTCIYVNQKMITYSGKGYNGCLRIIPTLQDNGQLKHSIGAGLFISEEARKALWVNLYIFDGNNPEFDTSAFKFVYGDDGTFAPLSLYQGRIIGPHKIWEVQYPEGYTVDEETKAKYLGGNELLPDYFYDVN